MPQVMTPTTSRSVPAVAGSPESPAPGAAVGEPITRMSVGQTGVVVAMHVDPADAAYLRAMGLCVNARVRVCRVGNPCVVAVGGTDGGRCRCGGRCRIGLSPRLAEGVLIAPALSSTPSTHS